VSDPYSVILRPVMTEKSHRLIDNAAGRKKKGEAPIRLYTFEVHPRANKLDIRRAVEQLFKVKVLAVNTQKVRPKPKRRGLRLGYTRGWKKAVVRLAAGQTIELY